MKKQIISVTPFQTAKVFAVLYFLMSIPFVLMMLTMMPFSAKPGGSLTMLILMPIFYMIFGFTFTIIGAWLYNLVAKRVGGIEYTSITVEED